MRLVCSLRVVGRISLAISICFSIGSLVRAQEFRSLLSSDLSTLPTSYVGSTTDGNTMTRISRFQNISGIPFVITGIVEIHSLDPEDLGFADMTLSNVESAKAAMLARYPNTDLFAWTLWVSGNQPRMTWTTELTFNQPFPIVVSPGEEFAYTRVSHNGLFGPNFGPMNAPLPSNQVNAIGEIMIAFDLDWHYVPEPSSAMLLISLFGLIAIRAGQRCKLRI